MAAVRTFRILIVKTAVILKSRILSKVWIRRMINEKSNWNKAENWYILKNREKEIQFQSERQKSLDYSLAQSIQPNPPSIFKLLSPARFHYILRTDFIIFFNEV